MTRLARGLSREQEALYDGESAGSMLVERVSYAGSENLTLLTRGLVDTVLAAGASETFYSKADRCRAAGQEENARVAHQTAQRYNDDAIAISSDTIPNIVADLREELEAVDGDTLEATTGEALNVFQEALHDQLFESSMNAADAERFEREVGESFDAVRRDGAISICDQLSNKNAQFEELRRSPDRGMTRNSPGPVVGLAMGVVTAFAGVLTLAYCIRGGTCPAGLYVGAVLLIVAGTYMVAKSWPGVVAWMEA